MTYFVAMLRGINVGGKTPVKMEALRSLVSALGHTMEALRSLVSALGHTEVTTYIQSGNVVFKAPAPAAAKLEDGIEARLKSELGLEVTVIVRSAAELAKVVRRNPLLPGASPATLYVIFLKEAPDRKSVGKIDSGHFAPDEFRVIGREIFARYPNGYGRSKMTNAYFEKALGVRGTARNWNTVTKLLQLSRGSTAKK